MRASHRAAYPKLEAGFLFTDQGAAMPTSGFSLPSYFVSRLPAPSGFNAAWPSFSIASFHAVFGDGGSPWYLPLPKKGRIAATNSGPRA